jgi:predicted nucleic acid-binding protein
MDKVMGYLLDTNVVSVLANPAHKSYQRAKEKEKTLQPGNVTISAITIAEIEYGLQRAEKPDPKQQDELRHYLKQQDAVRRFLDRYRGIAFGFNEHTVEPYALIRAKLWSKYPTDKKRPEELRDASGKDLGIDERDLLIVSIAAQYKYVFVTMDVKSMRPIEAAVKALQNENKPVDVIFNYWKF